MRTRLVLERSIDWVSSASHRQYLEADSSRGEDPMVFWGGHLRHGRVGVGGQVLVQDVVRDAEQPLRRHLHRSTHSSRDAACRGQSLLQQLTRPQNLRVMMSTTTITTRQVTSSTLRITVSLQAADTSQSHAEA